MDITKEDTVQQVISEGSCVVNFTFTPKWIIGGACLIAVFIVVGSYFGGHWYYGDVEPVPEELLRYTPTPAVSRGVSKGRLSSNDGSTIRDVSTSSNSVFQAANRIDDFSDFENIPVHYFPDGTPVPEHLLCPEVIVRYTPYHERL